MTVPQNTSPDVGHPRLNANTAERVLADAQAYLHKRSPGPCPNVLKSEIESMEGQYAALIEQLELLERDIHVFEHLDVPVDENRVRNVEENARRAEDEDRGEKDKLTAMQDEQLNQLREMNDLKDTMPSLLNECQRLYKSDTELRQQLNELQARFSNQDLDAQIETQMSDLRTIRANTAVFESMAQQNCSMRDESRMRLVALRAKVSKLKMEVKMLRLKNDDRQSAMREVSEDDLRLYEWLRPAVKLMKHLMGIDSMHFESDEVHMRLSHPQTDLSIKVDLETGHVIGARVNNKPLKSPPWRSGKPVYLRDVMADVIVLITKDYDWGKDVL